MDFFSDLFPAKSKRDLSLYAAVLLPPTLIAIADPNIFRGALDFAGKPVYTFCKYDFQLLQTHFLSNINV